MSVALGTQQSSRDRAPPLIPPHITPPARPLNRLASMARFIQNPLLVMPRAVYEEDYVPFAGTNLWITEPGLIKAVLLDQRDKFQKLVQIRILGPLLGKGILTSEGAEWKGQRQTSAPMFRHQELMTFVPTFVRSTERLLERWRRAPNGATHDVDRQMTELTFEVVSATLLPSTDATLGIAVEASTERFRRSGAWHQLYAITNAPKWLPQPGRRAMLASVAALRSAVADMLREQRQAPGQRDDLMRRLIEARDPDTGAPMNDEQLIDNLLTFYLAGHETTAKALTWTLYL